MRRQATVVADIGTLKYRYHLGGVVHADSAADRIRRGTGTRNSPSGPARTRRVRAGGKLGCVDVIANIRMVMKFYQMATTVNTVAEES
jgi:hypothetical protein